MKVCSYCGKEYPEEATACAIDGKQLTAVRQTRIKKGWLSFFGNVTAGPPLNEEQKTWLEQAFQWLLNEFGTECFLNHKLVLPEPASFPDKYQGTEEDVVKVVQRVCAYMDLNPDAIEVVFLFDHDDTAAKHRTGQTEYSGAAGLYFNKTSADERKKIAINMSQFKNPTSLVATIAHELGHVILLGSGKLSRENQTHEYVTDLLTVFFGLGIFTANSAFQFSQWQDHSHQGWSVSRMGYLPEEEFAYALAAYAWMRGDTNPKWSGHLAVNVRHLFNQSLNYLKKGGQTSLHQLISMP